MKKCALLFALCGLLFVFTAVCSAQEASQPTARVKAVPSKTAPVKASKTAAPTAEKPAVACDAPVFVEPVVGCGAKASAFGCGVTVSCHPVLFKARHCKRSCHRVVRYVYPACCFPVCD